jgi:hypothetical protein
MNTDKTPFTLFWHNGIMIYFFNVGHCLISVTKMPDMRIYQNKHNMLLNFPRCLSILLLQISKTDNNVLWRTINLGRPVISLTKKCEAGIMFN